MTSLDIAALEKLLALSKRGKGRTNLRMRHAINLGFLVFGILIGVHYQSNRPNKAQPPAPASEEGAVSANVNEMPKRILYKSETNRDKSVNDSTATSDKFNQLYQKQNFSEAAVLLDEMQNKWPKSHQYLEARSRLLVRTRDWEKAKEILKECVELYPNSKSCLLDLASTELQIGTKDDQQTAIQNCNEKLSQNPECKNMLGNLRINQGRYSEAERIFKQIITDNGSYGIRFNEGMLNSQLAIALSGQGRSEEAEIFFKKACQLSWENACERLQSFN